MWDGDGRDPLPTTECLRRRGSFPDREVLLAHHDLTRVASPQVFGQCRSIDARRGDQTKGERGVIRIVP